MKLENYEFYADHMEMVHLRHTLCNITLDDSVTEELKNVQQVVDLVKKHQQDGQCPVLIQLIDVRPHSRGCGIYKHDHGQACSMDCPTCGGKPL